MQAALVGDQYPLPAHWRLVDLQQRMSFDDSEFRIFKKLVREGAQKLGLNAYKPRLYQDPKDWEGFAEWVVEKQQKLRNFIDRWPIEAYFNFWTNHKCAFFRHCQRRKQNIKVYEPSKLHIKHPLSVPRNPDSANPYDAEAVRQPCLKCGEAPKLVSPFLNQLVQKDGIRKGELAKLGIRSDFDVDTILLLGPNEFDQLLRPTSMTNFEKASLKNSLRALKPSIHVREGVTEADLRDYLAKVYTCEQHCVFPLHMHVPRQILKLFNELHMEYLIPAVILLGVNSDANLQRASYFDDATLEDMIYEQSTHVCLSPLQKVALKWVLQRAS